MKNDENFRIHIIEPEKEEKHAHREIEINYVLSGTAELNLTGESFHMRKNDIILINSNKLHEWKNFRQCLVCRIFISDRLIKETLGRHSIHFWCNSVVNSVHDVDRLRIILNSLIKRYRSAGPGGSFSLECSKYLLLESLSENFLISEEENPAAPEDQRIGEVLDYINRHYSEKLSLGGLAERLYLSESYLSRLFKNTVGMTFREYISRIRLNNAVESLLYTEKSITQISQECGFENLSAFNKLFKKNFSCSPSEYKNRLRQNAEEYKENNGKISELLDNWIEERSGAKEEKLPGGQTLEITVLEKEGREVENNSIRCINFGTAWDLIQAVLQDQLLQIHNSLGFQYVRLENIFSRNFYMRVGRGSNKYTFAIVDMVLDFIVDNGMIPVIDLTVRSKHAYSDLGEELFGEEKVSMPFQDLTDWRVFMENFIGHLVRRYGIEKLGKWIFELDESLEYQEACEIAGKPCISYRELWKTARKVLKSLSPETELGGEILLLSDNEEIPDFVTCKIYPYSRNIYGEDVYSGRITDMDFVEKEVRTVRKKLSRLGHPDMKLAVTEWSTSISERNAYNDSCGKAAHVLRHLISLEGENCILCYHHGSDFLSQYLDTTKPLVGGNGLVTKDGICKPVFFSYWFMNQVRGRIMGKGENYLATCNREREYFILAVYPKNFSHVYYLNRESEITIEKLPDIYEDGYSLNLRITIEDMPGNLYEMRSWSMTEEEGSALYEWRQMGEPENLNADDVKYLKGLCFPRMKIERGEIKEARLSFGITLRANQISLIRIMAEE